MLKISLPDSSNGFVPITLGGESYIFDFQYNSLDKVYRLSIYYQDKLIIGSLDLKVGVVLTGKYDLPEFNHGELFLTELRATEDPPNRHNIGIGKPYELIYVSNEELL